MEVTSAAVKQYRPLVGRLAHQMIARLPANIEFDDIQQAGMIGLADAMSRFDAENEAGATFETFATQRIRGAMLDELRRGDWMARRVRKEQRDTATAVQMLEHRHGRPPRDGEVAAEIGVPLADYRAQQAEAASGIAPLSLDDAGDDDEPIVDRLLGDPLADPSAWLVERGRREALVEAIKTLPEREQQVLSMYFERDMGQAEIGDCFGICAPRVCQILGECIAKLGVKMRAAGHG